MTNTVKYSPADKYIYKIVWVDCTWMQHGTSV